MLLSDYLRALKGGWIILLVTTAVALACAAGLQLRKPDVYTASTQLFVAAAVSTDNPEELYQRNLIAAQRTSSYVALADGDVMAERVEETLGDEIDVSVVASRVPETVILQITATGSDPDRVAEVARAYAEVLPDVIDEVEAVRDAPAQVRVSVVDEADAPSAADSNSLLLPLVAAGVLGLGLGFAVVMIREVLRREKADRGALAAHGDEESSADLPARPQTA